MICSDRWTHFTQNLPERLLLPASTLSASCPSPVHALALPHPPVRRLCPLPQSPFGCFCVTTPALKGLLENLLWPRRSASAMWGLSSPGRTHVLAGSSRGVPGLSSPCCCPPPCALEILEASHFHPPSPAARTPSRSVLPVWQHQND